MADTTPSPNMNMPVPNVGEAPGPDWAQDLNDCLAVVDQHDHSPGYGTAVTPAGININADLTFAGFNATHFRSLRFTAQAAPIALAADLGCLYESGVDLYYNDGSGNQIRLTQSGGVAGTAGSIGSLTSPASATYVAGSTKFVWQADSSKSAAMDAGALIVRETNVASAKGVTIQSPSALGADYSLTLPTALPASTKYLSCTSGGVLSTASADEIAAAMTATGANAIRASTTKATGTSVGLGGFAISASCGSFSTANSSATDVTNLSVEIVTGGKPVFVGLISSNNFGAELGVRASAGATSAANFWIDRGGSTVARFGLSVSATGATGTITSVPASSLIHYDIVAAGTYTYKAQASLTTGTSALVTDAKLVAYEIT